MSAPQTTKFETPINWHDDRAGREEQIKREIRSLMDRVRRIQSELVRKMEEATAVDDEIKDQVRDQSLTAYSALLKVVEILLKVENGDRRLSRQDPAIVTTLDEAASHFYTLSEMSRGGANHLGKYAAQFMALGDQAAAFVGDLQSYANILSTDAPHILEVVNLYKSTLEKTQHRTQELKRQLNDAEESLGENGLNFAGLFDPRVQEQRKTRVREARQSVDNNRIAELRANEKMNEYNRFFLRHRESSSEVSKLEKRVQIAAAAFGVEFNKVTNAQTIENKLWDGLLGLRNQIDQTDYRTTRDNSLRVILKLLKMDDTVFLRQELYEDTEKEIKAAIKGRLGDDAVAKLIRETPGITDEQFQY